MNRNTIRSWITLLPIAAALTARGQFADLSANLPDLFSPAVAWGDFDGDGDLDFVLTGENRGDKLAQVFRNDAGTFTDLGAALTGVQNGALAWGDYDKDGDLDLALMGESDTARVTHVYRNNGGAFTLAANLTGVQAGSLAWGDFDNDGDLDLLVAGMTGTGSGGAPVALTRLYRNDGGTFAAVPTALPHACLGSVAWGDYDNDGDLDVLIGGLAGGGGALCRIYRNDGGAVFTDVNAGLPFFDLGNAAWGDYDNDGDLDLVVVGNGAAPLAKIFRNDGGAFTDLGAPLTGVLWARAAWGDYDNDGDLDLVVIGYDGAAAVSRVYRNDAGNFVNSGAGFQALQLGQVAWGDYDGDGRLDLLMAGTGNVNEGDFALIYRNVAGVTNTPPAAPTALTASVSGTNVFLSWQAASDAQTPAAGLTYNLRVGTSASGFQRVSPQADIATGRRRLPAFGNVQLGTNATLTSLTPGVNYFWSVQAVDSAFAGSAFAAEGSFTVAVNHAPVANTQTLTTPEDTPVVLTLAGADPDDHPLTFAVVTGPAHGTLTGTPPTLTYAPAPEFNGPDSFTFTANDGTATSALATVSLTVTPVNDSPVAASQSATTPEDTPAPVQLAGTDVDGDPLTFAVVTGPAHGTLSGTPPALTYTPAADFNGPDSFTFTANDGTATSTLATVSLSVTPVNDPPVAAVQTIAVPEDTPGLVILTGSDIDGDSLTFTVVSGPAHGTLTGAAPALIYTPATNYIGPDSFTFAASDGKATSAPATVSVTIVPLDHRVLLSSLSLRGDGFYVSGTGGAGVTYGIEASADPTPSGPDWIRLGTATADASGRFEFIDTNLTFASRFYRCVYP